MKKKRLNEGAFWRCLKRVLLIMKLTCLLLFIGLVSVAASTYSQSTKLSLNFENVTISSVLDHIEGQSEFVFIYKNDVVNLDERVNIHIEGSTVDVILAQLFQERGVKYEIIKKQIILTSEPVENEGKGIEERDFPPDKVLKGKVTDEDAEPIPGATVIVAGTTIGTITDFDGGFSLKVPENAQKLAVSFVGFLKTEVEIGNQSFFNVVLREANVGVEEVIVIGYGTQKKETVTGSISSVGTEELAKSPVANISNALVGRVPGLTAVQSSGEPGDNAATIRIRGVATLNSSGQEPLIIIDGIQSSFSVLNSLDPNEVENINVLKDASSTAVYGVRGANGVIIVTTKRGRTGKTKITFSGSLGVSKVASKLELLDSYHYALFRNEAVANDADPSFEDILFTEDELWKFQNNRDYTPQEVDAMDLTPEQKERLKNSPALYYTSNDYFEEQFDHWAPQQQYNINISGGSEKVRYFTSVGVYQEEGAFMNSDYANANTNSNYNRYNFRSNYDIDAVKNLSIKVNISGQSTLRGGILGKDGDVTSPGSRHKEMMVMILSSTPFAGPGIIDDHLVTRFIGYYNPLQQKGTNGYSPIAYILSRPYLTTNTNNMDASLKVIHTMDYLTKGLSIHANASYNNTYTKGVYRYTPIPQYTATRNPADLNELLFFGGTVGPESVNDSYLRKKYRRFYLEAAANYQRSFDKHEVTALALVNAQKAFDPNLQYNVPSGLMGLVGRITYNYDEKYLAEVNMGYNGSENFPEGSRFGFFPSLSAGWVISNESFFPENDWINWLKVRGSYGEVGNDKIGGNRYLYLPNAWGYGWEEPTYGYYFGDSNGASQDPFYPGAMESRVGNPYVTWERAKKSNIGLELNMLKNRLKFVGDIFQEKRDDILWPLGTVPELVGASLPPANIGRVSNRGYELQLGWRDQHRDFGYYVMTSVSYARNQIEYKDEPNNPYPWMNDTGFQLGQYKGFVSSGFYNNADEAFNRPYSVIDGNRVQAGDIRFVDINGDGIVDTKDNVPIGNANFPQYSFNATVGASYKGWAFSMLFTGTYKGSLPMSSFYVLNPFFQSGSAALQFQYDGRWTPEKAEAGITPTWPRASIRNYDTQNGVANDLWLMSTDFIRLKNAEVSYTISNSNLLRKARISQVKLFMNGNNLLTWSDMIKGFDPEQQDAGGASEGYLYPMMRTWNFGVNVEF
ncbi:TonB-linked outer membrane protein, SusC/RagA family [Sunxiuqinia elliptica]|uniref:TonB-linked outer membrane protein, SusC/RagA family n=2 Tax=Sunxiuqinia elliptica TaxID=655355 RepID=A0A1I2KKW7_9BACT|nr:TonB-linked outer membrane protein, SusC/RagA family [Sunxiuqinia elliptica]